MFRGIFRWSPSMAAAIFLAVATGAQGQEEGIASGYAPADQASVVQAGSNPQTIAFGQPGAGDAEQTAFLAPPAPDDPANADLAKRVADLERRLAEYSAAGSANPGASGKPLIAPTGRIQFDAASFNQNPASYQQFGNVHNAVGFRRARLALLGEYQLIDYIIEMDFANRGADAVINSKAQSTAFKDVYIQMRELPVLGNLRVGHFKECFGLDQLNSDNYTTFMERSLCDEGAFVPGRNNGIMAFNWAESQRATWAIGAFTNQTGFDQPPTFQYDHGGYDVTMRATYLPWYDEPSGGRGYLHTGVDFAYRTAPDHLGIFAIRPESAFAPSVVNLKFTDADHWEVYGAETAVTYGSLSLQSEVFAANVDRQNGLTNNFYGTYAYVSYFLTGENRPYNRKMGVFDRVRPYENFFRVRTGDGDVATGRGAWEIAYRFSYIDMLDGLKTTGAGRAADHTVGVNWYLNPYTRVMCNYVHSIDTYNVSATSRVSDGSLDTLMMRFAIDF